MHPELFKIPFLDGAALHTYGVLIASGFLIAIHLGSRQAGREGEDPDRVIDLAFYVLLAGLIGSRLAFIMTKWEQYARDPAQIVMFWRGGLVFYGGFIVAALYVFWYTRRHKLDFFKYADIIVPYLALAHAFGRMGCLAAGCCFGEATDVPWAIVFPSGSMAHAQHHAGGLVGLTDSALAIHPTQLYESGFEIMMFLGLTWMRPRKRFHGQLFLIWLAVYSVARSIIETFRGDKERGVWALGLSTSQYISIAIVIFTIWLFFYLRKKRLTEAEATAG